MGRILKRLGIALVIGLALLALLPGVLADEFELERSTVVEASAEDVAKHVEVLEGWTGWAPWGKDEDPDMVMSYAGPKSGVGAIRKWVSPKMGDGHMTVTLLEPARKMEYDLQMAGGFKARGRFIFEAKPEGEGRLTEVTWQFFGELPWFRRYFGLFIEDMAGPSWEKGLAALKRLAEGGG